MADPSVVIEAQSTAFSRSGTTTQRITRGTAALQDLTVPTLLAFGDSALIPGGVTLYNVQSLSYLNIFGLTMLTTLFGLDPFSTTYETQTTNLYVRAFATARAAAQSGPVNVRGGTARQAFELAELSTLQSINRFREIWENQLRVAQVALAAAHEANEAGDGILSLMLQAQRQQAETESSRMQANIAAGQLTVAYDRLLVDQFAAVSNFGAQTMTTTEALSGEGSQNGTVSGFGVSNWR